MNQLINLSNLLTLPRHGRGHGTTRGHVDSQGYDCRAFVPSDAPPGFSPSEVAESHCDKRQHIESSLAGTTPPEGRLTTCRSTASVSAWTPHLAHGNRHVSIWDSAKSDDTTLAHSQAFFLPGDMRNEVENSPNKLLSSFMVNSVKVCSISLLFMFVKPYTYY